MTRRAWDDQGPGAASADDLDTLVREFRADLRGLNRSLRRAVRLEWLRFRALAVESGIRGVLYFSLFGFLLAMFLSAGVFIALAVRDGLGNLGAGFAILGVLLGGGLILKSAARRQGVRTARRALEEEDEER